MNERQFSDSTRRATFAIGLLIFLLLATQFFLAGAAFSLWNLFQITTFEKAEGKISSVSVTRTTGRAAATYYDFRVSFQTPKGKNSARAGRSVFYSPYEKGDAVTVYYDARNHDTAFINTFGTLWFLPAVFFAIGLFLLVIANPRPGDFRKIYRSA